MNNVIDSGRMEQAHRVDATAAKLAEKLGDTNRNSWEFYCKVAWSLSEAEIWQLAEVALGKGRNPGALFNTLARKEMLRKGRPTGGEVGSGL